MSPNSRERSIATTSSAAASLYGGPFLEGFYVTGTPEFERWTSQERQRLCDRCAQALERLAFAAEKGADYRRAVD
jgi:DNA-binding SARP family transcriptional activator